MQFDQSFVAIRSRGTLELLDLSLQVIRVYGWHLLGLLACGAVPLIAIDFLVIRWHCRGPLPEYLDSREGWLWLILVYSQAQLGTVFLGHFLGQAVFQARPSWRATIRAVLTRPVGLIWLHLILRGGLLFVFLPLLFPSTSSPEDGRAMFSWMVIMVLVFGGIRLARPYVNEVLTLERPHFFPRTGEEEISFSRRSAVLHAGGFLELLGKGFLYGLIAAGLVSSFYLASCKLLEISAMTFQNIWLQESILWVAGLWLTAGFIAVARFLAYLDLRIRQEGWDVELLIRAESHRMSP